MPPLAEGKKLRKLSKIFEYCEGNPFRGEKEKRKIPIAVASEKKFCDSAEVENSDLHLVRGFQHSLMDKYDDIYVKKSLLYICKILKYIYGVYIYIHI